MVTMARCCVKGCNVILDISLTLLVMAIAFGLACWIAWREGRPLSAKGQKALRVVPYVGLGFAVYFASYVIWPPAGYEHPYVQKHVAGDAVFMLLAAGLASVYAQVASSIYAAGAAHHPAQVVQSTAQEVHLRRREWKATLRRARPLYLFGFGIAALAFVHGIVIRHGGWVTLSLLGAQAWMLLVTLGVRYLARKAVCRKRLR